MAKVRGSRFQAGELAYTYALVEPRVYASLSQVQRGVSFLHASIYSLLLPVYTIKKYIYNVLYVYPQVTSGSQDVYQDEKSVRYAKMCLH